MSAFDTGLTIVLYGVLMLVAVALLAGVYHVGRHPAPKGAPDATGGSQRESSPSERGR